MGNPRWPTTLVPMTGKDLLKRIPKVGKTLLKAMRSSADTD